MKDLLKDLWTDEEISYLTVKWAFSFRLPPDLHAILSLFIKYIVTETFGLLGNSYKMTFTSHLVMLHTYTQQPLY